MKNCAYCGRGKDEKDMVRRGKVLICWFCDENQKAKPRGKIKKSSGSMMENSNLF